MIGYNDKLYITFSRKIKESELERLFFTKLSSMGLNINIESNSSTRIPFLRTVTP